MRNTRLRSYADGTVAGVHKCGNLAGDPRCVRFFCTGFRLLRSCLTITCDNVENECAGDSMKKPTGKQAAKKRAARKSAAGFSDPAVAAVFAAYPKPVRAKLLALRRLIFETAKQTAGVGRLEETLKWGQPSYLTPETKSGSTIRIDQLKPAAGGYAVYFHCQTDLVETFRELYPSEFSYGGNRSILLDADRDVPEPALRHCVALALTYHRSKRKPVRGS
jgi:hypothetical protein